MRTRPAWIEAEVYFRIVHAPKSGHDDVSVATSREQTVEIALGPKGAFENGIIGALPRLVAADRVGSAISPRRCKPTPPRKPKTPRVVKLLRMAIEWRRQLDAGEVQNKAEIAQREGITRARVTLVMRLLRLAWEFQEQILTMPKTIRKPRGGYGH
jgi:hypothetical protein